MYVSTLMHAMPAETRNGLQILWKWCSGIVGAGNHPGTSAREPVFSTSESRAVSSVSNLFISNTYQKFDPLLEALTTVQTHTAHSRTGAVKSNVSCILTLD